MSSTALPSVIWALHKRGLRRTFAALVLLLTGASAPRPSDVRVCGEIGQELRAADGSVTYVSLYDRDAAEITSTFVIPTRSVRTSGVEFEGDATLRVGYHWPYSDFSPEPAFIWTDVRENGRKADGIIQFECGRRNMGLVNFNLSFGTPMFDSEPEDAVDCVVELDRDGFFRVSLDQRADVRTLLTGVINLRAARLRAARYIEEELAQERAGLCRIRERPPPT